MGARNDKAGKENPPQSPFVKGGDSDDRPLIHYVFRPENTYGTEFKGRKAVGIRDLGKGEPADLVIPERFAPYRRIFFGLDADWAQFKSNWLDLVVNVLGFIPFGALLLLVLGKWVSGKSRKPQGMRAESRQPTADSIQPTAKKANPPLSPFTKGGERITGGEAVLAVGLAVLGGVVVSFAIEYMQAYLPSRDSSMRDLVTNTAGTLIGALAAAWYSRKRMA